MLRCNDYPTPLRAKIIIVLLAAGCCALLLFRADRRGVIQSAQARQAEEERIAAALLAKPVHHFECHHLPFDQAVEKLGRESGNHLLVRWGQVEKGGIGRGQPIELNVDDARFSTVLRFLLVQASMGVSSPLDFRLTGDLITISTREDLSRNREIRIYDVNDLIDRLRGEHPSVVATNFDGGDSPTHEEIAEWIMKSVVEVDWMPSVWDYGDSGPGTVREVDGVLFVSCSPEAHAALADFLNRLRAFVLSQHCPGSLLPPVFVDRGLGATYAPPSERGLGEIRIADFRCDGLTLTQAASLLGKLAGVDILVEGTSPVVQDIDAYHRMSFAAQNITLKAALAMLLAESADERRPLSWEYRGGVIRIAPPSFFSSQNRPRDRIAYDVRDLSAEQGRRLNASIAEFLGEGDFEIDRFGGWWFVTAVREKQRRFEGMMAAIRAEAGAGQGGGGTQPTTAGSR